MSATTLILINGLPGVGKTTLSRRLAPDLNLGCLGKDDLKEFFFDKLHVNGREESRQLGSAVTDMLYMVARVRIKLGKSLILENAFFIDYARPAVEQLIDEFAVNVVEVYCFTSKEERRRRFMDRIHSGTRHQGHMDADDPINPEVPEPTRYQPIGLGTVIRYDTTNPSEEDYQNLIDKIMAKLEQGA